MKKHILLCVIGMTPQIITETIYALAKKKINIEELHVITTLDGKRKLTETLINKGILSQLIYEYNLPSINFSEKSIYLIKNFKNKPLSDIRTPLDNESAGELICKVVHKLTARKNTILHCSLAGGRKTMGFYLGAALQMYGRKDDKLYHVLVNEEFENLPEFFYPPAKSKEIIIKTKDGQFLKKSTSEVKIELAELPFLRLKELIDFSGKTFRELIDSTQIKFDNFKKIPYLGFIPTENILKIGDRKIKLSYNLWEFYTKLALQKKRACKHPQKLFCMNCTDCFLPMKGNTSLLTLFNQREENIRMKISKINSIIKNSLIAYYGKDNINFFLINSVGSHGSKKYGIFLDKLKIVRED
ncbi:MULTISPECIES: CRISPR-associated ring nuclease Csm6 [Thermodesulfovibrio]|uniref:CRISPR-associated ring nuclease Csm6 n=1 Tax=Thermodesulfovibrio yellowstonii TaxID=28262 RepID=UPI0004093508|nr:MULTISPECIES: CRISPR-associated ring nuclease Csm6 [Thermodesulfovibrio]MDI6865433.1 CRISPR-associated ring nuclease Csm6 [Thermodesulfovibrio yellowstonii]